MVNDFKDGVLCGLGVALNIVHPLRGGSAKGFFAQPCTPTIRESFPTVRNAKIPGRSAPSSECSPPIGGMNGRLPVACTSLS